MAEGKVKLDFEAEQTLDEKDVEKMIQYLNKNTGYKVVTDDEFKMLSSKHSSPKTEVKFEKDEGAPPRPPPPNFPFELSRIPPATPARNLSSSVVNSTLSNWQRPRIPTFSGDLKGETSFDVWKFEVKCIVREGNYSNTVVLQSIRNSFKGQARNLLLRLQQRSFTTEILYGKAGSKPNSC